jgi:hypothetical protein
MLNSLLVDLFLVGRIESLFLGDGRIARAPWLAIAEDVVEPNFHLAWPAHTGCVGTFYANDFKLPTAIARIIVVQYLSRLQHGVPRPLQPTDHDKPARSGRRPQWHLTRSMSTACDRETRIARSRPNPHCLECCDAQSMVATGAHPDDQTCQQRRRSFRMTVQLM